MQDTDPTSASPPQPQPLTHLSSWLRLSHAPGLGPVSCRQLLDIFHTPAAVLAAPPAALRDCIGAARTNSLLHPEPGVLRQIDAALAWAEQSGNIILTQADHAYPALLRHIDGAPLLLYVSGRAELLGRPSLAMVGSRNASLQGQANAEVMAEALAMAGLTIVSGLALGIDTAAHRGALAAAHAGSTVAVIGTGPDRVYPARNRALWQRICEQGCVVSEYPPGTPPLSHNFPQRNRIISGLSAGVLVVEAAAGSGSLITARLAASQGRDVFAIPGSIHAALSKGCHLLIKEGARLVESAADVLGELRQAPLTMMAAQWSQADAPVPDQHAALLAAIGHDPIDADQLARACARAPHEIGIGLLELELAGHVERLHDGRYTRLHRP